MSVSSRESATLSEKEIESLRRVIEETASDTGEVYFQRLVRSLAEALNVKHSLVASLKKERIARCLYARLLATRSPCGELRV